MKQKIAENGRKLREHDGVTEYSVCGKCGTQIEWANDICPNCGHTDTAWLYDDLVAIPDDGYYLWPEGGGWEYIQFRGGKIVGGAEEWQMGSHRAARDQFADLDPEDSSEVDAAISDAILTHLCKSGHAITVARAN
jgi:hypothetical protein